MKTQSTAPIMPIQDLGDGTWYLHWNIEQKEAEQNPMMGQGNRTYYQSDTVMASALTVDAVSEAIFREKYSFLAELALLKDFREAQMDEESEAGIKYNNCEKYRSEATALAKELLK